MADEGGGLLQLLTPHHNDDEEQVAAGAPVAPAVTAVTAEQKKKAWALRSIVKVFSTKVEPNYSQPWQTCPQRSSTGSGFVVDTVQRHILTNSHVVSNATALYVRRAGHAKKFRAEVVCDGKMCDLALLTVREDSFWTDDLRGLEFVDVPELQSPIAVAGYPVGGDSLSITKGIVSRLTLVRYSSAARLLGIQIDAAINPGNSGGPAFADLDSGQVAGVAFSKNVSSSTDNIGYLIPWRIVKHFLAEYAQHGSYRGVPAPGFVTQDLENNAQRAFLKVEEGSSGIMVVQVDPLAAAGDTLKKDDVITKVDGEAVADDGTVVFRDDERLDYTHIVRGKHIGDKLALTVSRHGEVLNIEYEVSRKDHLVPLLHGVDSTPSYFIIGGLVFMPLTSPFLEMVFGGRKSRRADIPVPVLAALNQNKTQRGQQVVILVQVLAHDLNHGYKYSVVPIETFNGTEIHNLRHLTGLVDACDLQYLNFGLEGGRLVTLDRAEAILHGPLILQTNSISSDRSPDLRLPPKPEDVDDKSPALCTGAPPAVGAAPAAEGAPAAADGMEA